MGGHHRSFSFATLCLLLTMLTCDVSGQGFGSNFIIGVPDGVPGVDYPNLTTIPRKTGFTCRDRKPGFYADPTTRCQVWHWCDTFLVKHSFICPNLTVFNQRIRACDWWYNVDCSLATSLYSNNDELYRDKDEDDYDENNNHLGAGNNNRPVINVEVHTTTRAPQILNNANRLNNGGFASSETLHSRVALTGNDVSDSTASIPLNNLENDFISTTESFNDFIAFQQPTQPPPPAPTQPPTTIAPPTTTTNRPANQLIILAPQRLPNGFNLNFHNAIPIAFPTSRPTGRFGPDPQPAATTNSPITHVPIQPVISTIRTPSEFARAENGGISNQGFNLRRRLRGRSRFQQPRTESATPLAPIATTARVENEAQSPTTSRIHFIAGNDPNFNFQPPTVTDNNFAVDQTTVQDFGNALNTELNKVAFTTVHNDEFPSTTPQLQDFTTTQAEFVPPTQTEDFSFQQLPITNPPVPVRSPKLILLREPLHQQPKFSVVPITTTPRALPPPSPIPQQQPTPFFNSGIPFGARLHPATTTETNTNSLDNSGVFRRHDIFSSTTAETITAPAPQKLNTKIDANFTSPTTVIANSNASFRKLKLKNESNRVKNTFPPFPVTTFAPKTTTELQNEQTELPKRKAQTAATVWFKIFPTSTATAQPITTTTTDQVTTAVTTEVTTTLPRKVSLRKKAQTTSVTKKRRTFPSFPITTFKPKIGLSPSKNSEFGAKNSIDAVALSTTEFDATEESTWPPISTTISQ